MVARARQIEIEAAAVELLEEYGLGVYPVSLGTVMDALLIDRVPYSSFNDGEKALAIKASSDKAFNVTSYDYMRAQVVFDDTHGAYYNRSRFSGGHEIGHIWLEHEENTSNREDEANYFSGYFLAPHPLIIAMQNPRAFEVSERFGVSEDCAAFAIDQANVRKREGGPWRPHEKWLLKNIQWKGGGLFGRA